MKPKKIKTPLIKNLQGGLCCLIFLTAVGIELAIIVIPHVINYPQFNALELTVFAIIDIICIITFSILIPYIVVKIKKERKRINEKVAKVEKNKQDIIDYLDKVTATEPQISQSDATLTQLMDESLFIEECPFCNTLNQLHSKICRNCGMEYEIT